MAVTSFIVFMTFPLAFSLFLGSTPIEPQKMRHEMYVLILGGGLALFICAVSSLVHRLKRRILAGVRVGLNMLGGIATAGMIVAADQFVKWLG